MDLVNYPYDAILVVSFGGPEKMADVMPFLENTVRGRNVPRNRLQVVADHYQLFGGVSPINQQNREVIDALRVELNAHGIHLPIYFGNRNWHPLLEDTVARMAQDGIHRALAYVTSAFGSYSGCRQYQQDIHHARQAVGPSAPSIDKLRLFHNHPLFIEALTQRLRDALEPLSVAAREEAPIIFTAHSIPLSMAQTGPYEGQLRETCRLVSDTLGLERWSLAYQSRSGPPTQPWLEPDICDHLRELARRETVREVVIAPIGFLTDHMEVIYDLDVEAAKVCAELGMHLTRAKTVGDHPSFIRMLRELIVERLQTHVPRRALGQSGPWPDVCPQDCCAGR